MHADLAFPTSIHCRVLFHELTETGFIFNLLLPSMPPVSHPKSLSSPGQPLRQRRLDRDLPEGAWGQGYI